MTAASVGPNVGMVQQVEQAVKSAPNMGLDRMEAAAEGLTLVTEEDHKVAGEMLREIATRQQQWNRYWEDVIAAVKLVYDLLREKRDGPLKRLKAVREKIEEKMAQWNKDQRRQQAALAVQATLNLQNQKEALEAEVRRLVKAGKILQAEQVRNHLAILPETATPPLPDMRLDGVGQGKVPEFEIEDPIALAKGIADGIIPLAAVKIELRVTVVKEHRKAMGKAFDWPGIKVSERISYRPKAYEE